jgi:hypothetical protein
VSVVIASQTWVCSWCEEAKTYHDPDDPEGLTPYDQALKDGWAVVIREDSEKEFCSEECEKNSL